MSDTMCLQALIARLENFRANEVRMGRMTGHQDDTLRLVIDELTVILAQQQDGQDRDIAFTLKALSNYGADVTCGACMEVAFTSITMAEHTCAAAVLQPPQEGQK